MMPVVPCPASNISFIPGSSSTTRKNRPFSRYTYAENRTKQSLSSQRFFISLPRTIWTFSQLRNEHPPHHKSSIEGVSARGADDVAVEEQETTVADEASAEEVDTNGKASAKSDVSGAPTQAKKRWGRKSEMPPVKDEDLVPGAIFTGKVRSIQPFGAFVDFGAFTDGLVHLSRLSDSFVKDVNDVVSLGQEVKVRLVEVNIEAGRISLSMRDDDDESSKSQKKAGGPSTGSDKPRSSRKNASKPARKKEDVEKDSKFTTGQNLVGTVKNFGRSGAFVSLPEDEEGFLPTEEEPNGGIGNIMGRSLLEVGQEVDVRVLRVARGSITLTMKEEDEDEDELEVYSLDNDDGYHTAANPFAVAFRRDKVIAAFLEEREKIEEPAKIESSENESTENVSDVVNEDVSSSTVNGTTEEDASPEILTSDASKESSISSVSQSLDVTSPVTEEEAEVKSEVTDSEVQADTCIPDNGVDINETPSVSQELSV